MSENRILVVCAVDIATSTIVSKKLGKMLKEKGFKKVKMRTGKVNQCSMLIRSFHPDLIVFTGQPLKNLPVPAVTGVEFISGIGANKKLEQIIEILQQKKA